MNLARCVEDRSGTASEGWSAQAQSRRTLRRGAQGGEDQGCCGAIRSSPQGGAHLGELAAPLRRVHKSPVALGLPGEGITSAQGEHITTRSGPSPSASHPFVTIESRMARSVM